MTLYSIFERRAAEAPEAVPERFSWLAALLPPVFALVHGLWLELLAYGAAILVLALLGIWLGSTAALWLYLLFAAWIGFEAPTLRRAALRRRGWAHRGERFAASGDAAAVDWLRSTERAK